MFQCLPTTLTYPRRGGRALVSRLLARSHLVHPRAAVVHVPAEDEACLQVDADLVVEPLVEHMFVNAATCVPLAKLQTLEKFFTWFR